MVIFLFTFRLRSSSVTLNISAKGANVCYLENVIKGKHFYYFLQFYMPSDFRLKIVVLELSLLEGDGVFKK